METSTIILYADCKLKPEKNFMADNISDFLDDCSTSLTKYNQQYIKHGLNIEVKLITPQDPSGLSLSYNKGINYNYCSIQNTNDLKPIYYFIINKEWISVGGLKLQLIMDTLNSFKLGEDYDLSDKTIINRQHKDRFYKYGFKNSTLATQITALINPPVGEFFVSKENWDTTRLGQKSYTLSGPGIVRIYDLEFNKVNEYTGTITSVRGGLNLTIKCGNLNITLTSAYIDSEYYYSFQFTGKLTSAETNYFAYTAFQDLILKRKIDFESEGITPRLLKSFEEQVIDPKNELTWYYTAITSSDTGNVPIESYIVPSEDMQLVEYTGSYYLTQNNFEEGKEYYFGWGVNNTPLQLIFYDSNNVQYILNCKEGYIYSVIKKDITGNFVIQVYKKGLIIVENIPKVYAVISQIEVASSISFRKGERYLNGIDGSFSYQSSIEQVNKAKLETFYRTGTSTLTTISGIKALDRTDKRLNKLIELPYCPFNLTYSKNVDGVKYYTAPSYIEKVSRKYGWGSASIDMLFVKYDYFDTLFNQVNTEIEYKNFMSIDEDYLKNSSRKILEESKIYHSDFFIKKFVYDSFNYTFNYELLDKASINDSVLRFNFVMSKTLNSKFLFDFNDFLLNRSYEDYDNIMVVARNNQIPVYNSEYLNYLRTDYNYDVKAKNRAAATQYINTVPNVVNSTLSGASSGAKLGAVGGPVGAAVGAVVGGIYGAGSSIYGEVAKAEARNDAFNQKIDNLKYQKASVETSDDIDLMSYYTNQRAKLVEYKAPDRVIKSVYDMFYYTGYIDNVQEKPDLYTRKNWNYCQCSPDIINNKNISDIILNNIALRMESGFTLFHNNTDLEQKLENKETWRLVHES